MVLMEHGSHLYSMLPALKNPEEHERIHQDEYKLIHAMENSVIKSKRNQNDYWDIENPLENVAAY